VLASNARTAAVQASNQVAPAPSNPGCGFIAPPNIDTNPACLSGGGSVTLSANNCAGTVVWYQGATIKCGPTATFSFSAANAPASYTIYSVCVVQTAIDNPAARVAATTCPPIYNCESDYATKQVNVYPSEMTILGATSDCKETTLSLQQQYGSYQWFKDGVAISGATNQSLTVNYSGSYSVSTRNVCTNGPQATQPVYVSIVTPPISISSSQNGGTIGIS
jgi:hypothetical protein